MCGDLADHGDHRTLPPRRPPRCPDMVIFLQEHYLVRCLMGKLSVSLYDDDDGHARGITPSRALSRYVLDEEVINISVWWY